MDICFYKVVIFIYTKSSAMILNKNTWGVKRVRGQSEVTLQTGKRDQKV